MPGTQPRGSALARVLSGAQRHAYAPPGAPGVYRVKRTPTPIPIPVAATVQYIGANGSASVNPTLTVPAGMLAGDLMIVGAINQSATTPTVTSHTFTTYDTGTIVSDAWSLMTRVMDGTETSITLSSPGGAAGRSATSLVLLRNAAILVDVETVGTAGSEAIATMTMEPGNAAVVIAIAAFGVVSSSPNISLPYIVDVGTDSSGGKHSVDMGHEFVTGTTNSAGTVTYPGASVRGWNQRTLRIGA